MARGSVGAKRGCRPDHVRSRLVWNPWRALADVAHVRLLHSTDLPDGTLGLCDFGPPPTITLDSRMTQAQRRSTLAHELVHLERGPLHYGGCVVREEAAVDRDAARRLIAWRDLVDAMLWCADEHELAERLWVDVPTAVARLAALTQDESRELDRRLDDAELRIP